MTTEFDRVFDQMEAPEYPATCDNCGYEATNAEIDQHICNDAPAAPERHVSWTSVNMTEDPRDPRFTIEEGDKLLATVYDAATAARIITEHNLLNQARTQGANWTIEEWQQWQTTL